ncbi:TraB/GumN family protein [Phaeovulum vinaykumarii]|uniref:TraB family protein n=1 Tax=Phaeovulum vinaykumarii TaxID=407234 RepID=A0A1N7JN61_9RHOB|nr:TraB/GumN family protein [Phaeovulum vinaykumarii]SIS50755.1 hypothetical protein SAMN05421795_101181 [Phaeovulum vinaykumarii]SOB90407.1 hypothetical protein SAMN05878426_101181 [Phaeovulum vinaykumarii]
MQTGTGPAGRLWQGAGAVLKTLRAGALLVPLALALAGAGAAPARALCAGADMLAELPAADRAAIERAAAQAPYAEGLMWRATRGTAQITLLGTYHFADPRHDALVAAAAPVLRGARRVLMEASPEDQAALQAALARDPSLMFTMTGPTLPERLSAQDWARLSAAVEARGIPAILAAKFKPWYVAMTLALSPCAMAEQGAGAKGLDERLMAAAAEAGVPVAGLEPFDTVFKLFGELSPQDEVDLILASLGMAERADDYTATLARAYFAQKIWLIWEFGKFDTLRHSGLSRDRAEAQIAVTQDILMDRRNAAWIAPMVAAAEEGPILVAVGALHLPGPGGVLARLAAEGFRIERLALPVEIGPVEMELPEAEPR